MTKSSAARAVPAGSTSRLGSVGPSTHAASPGDWWETARATLLRERLERPGGAQRILLDVGCGSGYVVSDEVGISARLRVGIDAWKWSEWDSLNGAVFVVADVRKLPFRGGSADVALVLDVLEHLSDDIAPLDEVRRVLRPDGRAVITVPAFDVLWSSHDDDVGHYRRYRLRDLAHPLSASGLRVVRWSYFFAWLFPLALLRRALHLGGDSDRTPQVLAPIARPLGRIERYCIRHGITIPFGSSAFVEAALGHRASERPGANDATRETA